MRSALSAPSYAASSRTYVILWYVSARSCLRRGRRSWLKSWSREVVKRPLKVGIRLRRVESVDMRAGTTVLGYVWGIVGEEDISEMSRDVCDADVSRSFKRIYDEEVSNSSNRLKLVIRTINDSLSFFSFRWPPPWADPLYTSSSLRRIMAA